MLSLKLRSSFLIFSLSICVHCEEPSSTCFCDRLTAAPHFQSDLCLWKKLWSFVDVRDWIWLTYLGKCLSQIAFKQKGHRLAGMYTTNTYFSPFWRQKSKHIFWWDALLSCRLLTSSYILTQQKEGERALLGPFYKGSNSIHEGRPSCMT
jgi:hypothetical protein